MTLPVRAVISCIQLGSRIDCHLWDGWIASLQEIPDRIRRLGQIGSHRQSLGQEAPTSTVRILVWCRDKPTAIKQVETIEALRGYDCHIQDGYGRVLKRVTVDRVSVAKPKRGRGPIIAGTTQATYQVEATLEVERQPEAPANG